MKDKLKHSKQKRLGWVAGLFLGRCKPEQRSTRQLYQQDFKSSTRRMGVRFSDRLRQAFRHHWIKLK